MMVEIMAWCMLSLVIASNAAILLLGLGTLGLGIINGIRDYVDDTRRIRRLRRELEK